MKRILILVILATSAFAGDNGIGASVGYTNFNIDVPNASASQSNLGATLFGAIGLGNGWELDPFVNIQSISQKDPNAITASGSKYTDGWTETIYGLGLTAYNAI